MERSMNEHTEDDFIDMEVSSFSNMFRASSDQREFEFHMTSNSHEKQMTSPADELFYQGKLLPLHLPPRLQMVEKLLEQANPTSYTFEEFYSTPLTTTATTPTAMSTPFESCNISPTESCSVSREINPEEYFLQCPAEGSFFVGENPKKSWTKKLKLMKQSAAIGLKLKASGVYLKSWFGKSGGSADSSCKGAAKVADEGTVCRARESLNSYVKAAKKAPFGQIQKDRHEMATTKTPKVIKQRISDTGSCHPHRRSFSMAIKRNFTSKSLLSSSTLSKSNGSNGNHAMPLLKKSSSMNSEIENPIQGAIAHCKQSQQLFVSR